MPNGLDVLLAPQGAQATSGLDVLLGSAAPSQATPAPAKPLSLTDRIMQGLNDVSAAGAQLATHVLPSGVVNAVNKATQYVNDLPVIGPATQMLGMVPATAQSLDQDIKQNEQNYQARRLADTLDGKKPGIDWARMGGNALAAIPMAAALPAAGGVGGAALQGAAFGALSQPVTEGDFAKEKAKQMALGAVTGAGTNLALGAISRAVAPKINPDVQTLLDAGVTPTPGQIVGGAANRLEQAATSVPVLGDVIKNAQRRTVDQFNTAAVNRSLEPIGESLPQGVSGREAIDFASQKLGNAYDAVVNKIGSVKPDNQFLNDLANLQGMTTNLPKSSSDQFSRIVDAEILDRFKNGQITGEALKAAESNLGSLARGYGKSADFDQRQLGTAIQQAQATLRDMIARVRPDAAADLANINAGYANLLRVQRAAASVGSEGGTFTPAQLQSAVKALDASRNNRQFATGQALMQDLSEAGKNVMGSKVPDSGTPYRSAATALGAALLGHSYLPAEASALMAPVAGGAGLMSLPYTTQGQKLAALLLTQRPAGADAAAQFLSSLAPYAGASAAVAPALSK